MNRGLAGAIDRAQERAHAAIARGIRRHGWMVKKPGEDESTLVRVFDAQDIDAMRRLYPNAEISPE